MDHFIWGYGVYCIQCSYFFRSKVDGEVWNYDSIHCRGTHANAFNCYSMGI